MPIASEVDSSRPERSIRPRQNGNLPNELLVLAESQWLFTEGELLRTPSIIDGLSPDKERENRSKGVNFILQVGIMLKLPQITLATASVFLHRFFMRHSMLDAPSRPGFHYYSMAATSLFLATKVEENCRKMKELVIACVRVAQKDPHKVVDEQDREFWRWKDNILHNEDLLLEALCFDLSLEPPYKKLFEFLIFLGEENNKRLRNAAWAFVNDSYLTTICLIFPSRTVAASALYAAAKHCDVNFPDDEFGTPWWESLGVELKNIRKACNFMAGMYETTILKASRDGRICERTPEDGDEDLAKTRYKHERTIVSTEEFPGSLRTPSFWAPEQDEAESNSKWEDDQNTAPKVFTPGSTEIQNNNIGLTSHEAFCDSEGIKSRASTRLSPNKERAQLNWKSQKPMTTHTVSLMEDVSEEGEVNS